MRDYLLRREFLHGIILGIAIALTILVARIQQNPPLIEIKLPPLFPHSSPHSRPSVLSTRLLVGLLVDQQ